MLGSDRAASFCNSVSSSDCTLLVQWSFKLSTFSSASLMSLDTFDLYSVKLVLVSRCCVLMAFSSDNATSLREISSTSDCTFSSLVDAAVFASCNAVFVSRRSHSTAAAFEGVAICCAISSSLVCSCYSCCVLLSWSAACCSRRSAKVVWSCCQARWWAIPALVKHSSLYCLPLHPEMVSSVF